ncbi:MAG: putative sugar O-methyltransferase [Candidatus Omnitrophica bacterium]|nr:putative sugar O-methyltransferase [Candidatus Omnitrophota bacterium]
MNGCPEELLSRLQGDVQAAARGGLLGPPKTELLPKWERLISQEPRRLLKPDGSLSPSSLERFRQKQLFVPDDPTWDPHRLDPRNFLGGGRRGILRTLEECLEIIRRSPDAERLLRKYPSPRIGQPHLFRRFGYTCTYRWLKHIWSLGLLKASVGQRLGEEALVIDIGSSYGIFSGLVKQEWPRSCHLLVDFSEQLLLAHYFLKSWLPRSRVAGIREVLLQPELTRRWLQEYDFVLVPCSLYGRLRVEAPDLVTNFASLGEMTRPWFASYMDSRPVQTARFLFLVNRVESRPTYPTDLGIVDYPIRQGRRCLHFAVSPIFSEPFAYRRRCLFFSEKIANPPYFEYVGERCAII